MLLLFCFWSLPNLAGVGGNALLLFLTDLTTGESTVWNWFCKDVLDVLLLFVNVAIVDIPVF